MPSFVLSKANCAQMFKDHLTLESARACINPHKSHELSVPL